jgi:hypothetical protein
MHDDDRCSKWQIEHHGDSILHMARAPAIKSWRALQAELVQHRRLPDGLLWRSLRFSGDCVIMTRACINYSEGAEP